MVIESHTTAVDIGEINALHFPSLWTRLFLVPVGYGPFCLPKQFIKIIEHSRGRVEQW